MPEDYSIQNTTKLQREKYISDTLNLARLGGTEPSDAAKSIAQEYIDGKTALADVRDRILMLNRDLIQDGDSNENNG